MPTITSIRALQPLQLSATLTRVSVASDGTQGDAGSSLSASMATNVFSGDGRLLVFETAATNFYTNGNGAAFDAVTRDLFAGTTTLSSFTSSGGQPIDGVANATLSATGRYQFFLTDSYDMIVGDANGASDVFRRDTATGAVVRADLDSASAELSGGVYTYATSADGRLIAFETPSAAVAGDTNGLSDVYLRNLDTGQTTWISAGSNGSSGISSMSADGRYVAFSSSATNLVALDTNGMSDVFFRDTVTNTTTRVSTATGGVQATGGDSFDARISADGRYVAFVSDATNLVAGGGNAAADIYRKDLWTGVTVRVSTDSSNVEANNVSEKPRISADGRYIAFESSATNLVAGDTNAQPDVFVKDMVTGVVTRVSYNPDTATQANGAIWDLAISPDGRFVTINTSANNLVAGGVANQQNVFVYDMDAAVNKTAASSDKLLSVSTTTSGGDLLKINWGDGSSTDTEVTSRADVTTSTVDHAYAADGRYTVTFSSSVVGGPTTTSTATIVLATNFSGLTLLDHGFDGPVDNACDAWGISANGRYVALLSSASNLVPGWNSGGYFQLYLQDTTTGAITPISANASAVPGNDSSVGVENRVFLSDDGKLAIFTSLASNLVFGDVNGKTDVFSKNLATGAVSVLSTSASNALGDSGAVLEDTSPNGQWIVMQSASTNLVATDTNGMTDMFLKNTTTGAVENVSVDSLSTQANASSSNGRVSANGRYVAFDSTAFNLVAIDTNSQRDVFLRDTVNHTTTRIGLGGANAEIAGGAVLLDLSDDGAFVLFETQSSLDPRDTNSGQDVYLRNIATGAITLVSVGSDGVTAPGGAAWEGAISRDNRYITFTTTAAFDAGDTNATHDVFRKDLATGALIRISSAGGVYGGNALSLHSFASSDGQTIAFSTSATDLTGAGGGPSADALLWQANSTAEQVLAGTAGVDIVQASPVRDAISTAGGADTIHGYGGADVIDGGAGSDTADYSEKTAAVAVTLDEATWASVKVGGVAEDTIRNIENVVGGSAADTLTGDGLANTLSGGVGADLLTGGGAADLLDGGAGVDTANYGDKTVAIAVTLNGATNAAVKIGGIAEDTIRNIEKLLGGSAADTLTGDSFANVFRGGLGADILDGGAGSDTADYSDKTAAIVVTLNGATNAAVKVGGAVEDTIRNFENIYGGSAADTLFGDSLVNVLAGGGGDDLLRGGVGKDTLDGSVGSDWADYRDKATAVAVTLNGATNATVTVGGATEDTIRNIERVLGGSGADTLTGDSLVNTFRGGAGADILDGGAGVDCADYSDKTTAVIVTLNGAANASVKVGGSAEDTIRNIENVIGGAAADTLTGDALANGLSGGGGNDVLTGGAGNDVLAGGAGADAFVFKSPSSGLDTIADFTIASDHIDVSASGFGGGLVAGGVAALVSGAHSAAMHAGAYFIYEVTGGQGTLYWDSNGASGADAAAFARLTGAPTLAATDLHIIA
jgi:Ca2+-binding RTX toxin-like protein